MKGPKNGVVTVKDVKFSQTGKNVLLVSIPSLEEKANQQNPESLELLDNEKKAMFAAIKQDLVKKYKNNETIQKLEINITDTLQVENLLALPNSRIKKLAKMYFPGYTSAYLADSNDHELNKNAFLYALAQKIGDKLTKEITDIFNQDRPTPLTVLTITKWDKHETNPDYQNLKKLIYRIYDANAFNSTMLNDLQFVSPIIDALIQTALKANTTKDFKKNFDNTIDDFLQRQHKHYENGEQEVFETLKTLKRQQSLSFLVCEAAGHILDAAAGVEKVIYFGKRIPALNAIHSTFIEPYNTKEKLDLCKWIDPFFEKKRPESIKATTEANPSIPATDGEESKSFASAANASLPEIDGNIQALIFQSYAQRLEEQFQTFAAIISHQNEALKHLAMMTLIYPQDPSKGLMSFHNTEISNDNAQTFKETFNKQTDDFQALARLLYHQKASSHYKQAFFPNFPKPTTDTEVQRVIHKVSSAPTLTTSNSVPIDITKPATRPDTSPQSSPATNSM